MSERRAGTFVLSGPVKSRKTTSGQATWGKDSLTILTSPDIMHYYERELAGTYGMPARRMLLDRYTFCPNLDDPSAPKQMSFDENGDLKPMPANTIIKILSKLIRDTHARVSEGKAPEFPFVIIDEGGELFDWRYEDLKPLYHATDERGKTKFNARGEPKINTQQAYGALNDWAVVLGDKLKALKTLGVGSVVLTHAIEPDMSEGKKGGPKLGSKNCSKKIAGKADGSLMSCFVEVPPATPNDEATTRFYWECKQHPHYELGLRGLTQEVADQAAKEGWPLREIIQKAGW